MHFCQWNRPRFKSNRTKLLVRGFFFWSWHSLSQYSDYVMGWTSRVRFPAGAGNFSLRHCVQTGSETTQSPIRWAPGVLFPEEKLPGCEADDLPPSSADVKNAWSYTCTDSYVLMAWCLVKFRLRLHGVVFT